MPFELHGAQNRCEQRRAGGVGQRRHHVRAGHLCVAWAAYRSRLRGSAAVLTSLAVELLSSAVPGPVTRDRRGNPRGRAGRIWCISSAVLEAWVLDRVDLTPQLPIARLPYSEEVPCYESRRILALSFVILGLAIVSRPTDAHALTYVTHCSNQSWPGWSYCPLQPSGARHTYVFGRAASNAASLYLYHFWYVAYTNSDGSTAKYVDAGTPGTVLYSAHYANTELLRGYSEHGNYGALFGDGAY